MYGLRKGGAKIELKPTNHKTQRTCVTCRRKEDQGSFFRVSRDADSNGTGGRVGLWKGRERNRRGRSAYICRTADCVNAAMSKGRLDRALKGKVMDEERLALQEVLLC